MSEQQLWTVTMPVLSTIHISKDTARELDNMSRLDADVAGVAICAEYSRGYFLKFDENEDPGRMSDDIAKLRTWCLERKFTWARLDVDDGDHIDELPTHDW